MDAAGHERDGRCRKREIALLVLEAQILRLARRELVDERRLGVHFSGRVRVAEFIRENTVELLAAARLHRGHARVIRSLDSGEYSRGRLWRICCAQSGERTQEQRGKRQEYV